MYICDKANECSNVGCYHQKGHDRSFACMTCYCSYVDRKVRCIPMKNTKELNFITEDEFKI